ncbi:agmatinase [Methanobrevibacter arboriphilus]|jgi:agmatinase|uniref:Agmatinase n=1 Tax=Methanobrevibacter arboriphilus TaxID=39441 RepID=A0ACA8R5K0_METAZ|nr:agmatinase [Methanobrevibacter arboriphilus]MCC7561399.1 agmatinase [Methanobrevibacter arboriphilus]BBL62784.1 agmatinase [Methanobrevibacter arboriphilus]GLI12026.1 agmatinase [Methanobrevibacter arboriphilus]
MLFNTYKPWKFAFSQETENLKETKENSWGIIGVPFDSTSSYGPGSRFGPTTVREASYSFEKYNITLKSNLDTVFYDFGNINVIYGNCKETIKILEDTISDLIEHNIKPITIGGEHSVSLAPIKALSKKYDIEDMTIIHLDAHMDIIDEYQGEKCSHATIMKRVYDLKPKEIIEIGIRSASLEEKEFVDRVKNVTIFTANDTKEKFENIKDKINRINEDEPIYLSIDMDVLDPLYAPEVGNPIPNGISPEIIENILKILANKNVIGFDLVEVATSKLGDPTAVTGSKIIYDFLSLNK